MGLIFLSLMTWKVNDFLGNLKVLDKIVNPPTPKSAEVHLFSKLPGDPITPEAFAGQKAADQAKLHSEVLKQSMRLSKVDQELAKKLNLDMSKASNDSILNLQAWKEKTWSILIFQEKQECWLLI